MMVTFTNPEGKPVSYCKKISDTVTDMVSAPPPRKFRTPPTPAIAGSRINSANPFNQHPGEHRERIPGEHPGEGATGSRSPARSIKPPRPTLPASPAEPCSHPCR